MKKSKTWFRKIAAIIGIAACAGDIFMTLYMGSLYPGYSQITDTMSKLGATASPVGHLMSLWWEILCLLFVVFALGFRKGFNMNEKYVRFAFWLIVIYALGEGMGSGVFPADHSPTGLSVSLMIHDILGGIGIAGIMALPFVLKNSNPFNSTKFSQRLTLIVSYTGPVWLILFSLSKVHDAPDNFIFTYKGLWQRLLMLNYYAYIIALGIWLWKESSKLGKNTYRA